MIELERHDGVSRLELGRMAAGEVERAEGPALAAFEAEVASEALPSFDWVALEAASHRVDDPASDAEHEPAAPWWQGWFRVLLPVAVALLAFVAIRTPDEPTTFGTKGHADLDFYVEQDGSIRPGIEGETLAPGDRVQFTYRADGLDNLVLVNVDGTGALTVFYPEDPDGEPLAVVPGGRQLLEGSIQLDDAPGPEVFVAVFGVGSVDEAVELVEVTFDNGGHDALERLPETDDGIDVVRLEKSP